MCCCTFVNVLELEFATVPEFLPFRCYNIHVSKVSENCKIMILLTQLFEVFFTKAN